MAHRTDNGESIPCTRHVQVRKQHIKRLCVEEVNGFGNVSGSANLELTHFQDCL